MLYWSINKKKEISICEEYPQRIFKMHNALLEIPVLFVL